MKKQIILTGYLLIAAAITFWIAWFLMPDPGTTDTRHILEIVNRIRPMVFSSVVLQIISSVLYLIVLFLLATIGRPRQKTIIGFILWAIGAMGMCADAFFHLLAWYMTDASVTINEDVVRVMDFTQTSGVNFLIPLMLPFFIGGPMAAWGFYKQGIISKKPVLLFISAFIVGLAGMLVAKVLSLKEINLLLSPLALFAASQILTGYEMIKSVRKEDSVINETLELSK